MDNFQFTDNWLNELLNRFQYNAKQLNPDYQINHPAKAKRQMLILIDACHDLSKWRDAFHLCYERINQEVLVETEYYKRNFDYDQILFFEVSMSTVFDKFKLGGVMAIVDIEEITPQLIRDLRHIPNVAMVHVNA